MATRHPERYQRLLARLREARKAAGMSQEAVAEALGVAQKYVSQIETAEHRIDPVELQELAALYGKPLEFFLTSIAGRWRAFEVAQGGNEEASAVLSAGELP